MSYMLRTACDFTKNIKAIVLGDRVRVPRVEGRGGRLRKNEERQSQSWAPKRGWGEQIPVKGQARGCFKKEWEVSFAKWWRLRKRERED